MTSSALSTCRFVPSGARAVARTVFAAAAALAVCVALLFWTPLETPASWRAATQTGHTAGRP